MKNLNSFTLDFENIHTSSAVYVVKIANTVFVSSIAGFTGEARLSWALSTRVLNDHGLSQILVQFERRFSLFHELGRLW